MIEDNKTKASFVGLGILGLVLIFALLIIPSFSADTTIFLTNGSNGNSTGGGNVTSVNAGTGISVNQTTGNVLVTNTLPESTSGSNVGNGANVFKNMTSAVLYFKTLLAGSDVSITNGTNTITITNTAPDNTACTNVGTGSQVYKDGECNFRTLGHGTGITLTNGTDLITINNSSPESTSASNVGNGANVFKNMTGTVLYFKTLLAGTGIQVTNSTNTITLTNIGVTSLSGTSPISVSDSTGSVDISCSTCLTTSSTTIIQQLGQSTAITTGDTINILTQNVGTATTDLCYSSGGVRGCAEKITSTGALIGFKVNSFTAGLSVGNTGNTGTCTVGVMDSSQNIAYTFGTIDVSTLTTTQTAKTFTNTASAYIIATNDYIGLKCTGVSGTQTVLIGTSTTDSYDSTNSVLSTYNSGWTDNTGRDLGDSTGARNWKLDLTLSAISVSITAKNHILFTFESSVGASTTSIGIRFNSDSGTNYADRFSNNGGADTTNVSQTSCLPNGVNTFAKNDAYNLEGWVKNNQASERKLVNGMLSYGGDTSSATAPAKVDYTCKWSNTANQITSIQIQQIGTGYLNNSILTIWGYD